MENRTCRYREGHPLWPTADMKVVASPLLDHVSGNPCVESCPGSSLILHPSSLKQKGPHNCAALFA